MYDDDPGKPFRQGCSLMGLLLGGVVFLIMRSCPDEKRPSPPPPAFTIAGTVSSTPGLRSAGYTEPDERGIVMRQEQFADGQAPALWALAPSVDPVGQIPTTYFVEIHITNAPKDAKSVEVQGYFFGDGGDLLKIKASLLSDDRSPMPVAAGQSISFQVGIHLTQVAPTSCGKAIQGLRSI